MLQKLATLKAAQFAMHPHAFVKEVGVTFLIFAL